MAKLIHVSPLEEIENPMQDNLITIKNNCNNFDGLDYNLDYNVLNGKLDLDTEEKMNNSSKNEKQFIHLDEPLKDTSDINEGNIINKNPLLLFNDKCLQSFKYYIDNIDNSIYLKYIDDNLVNISDTQFKELFLKIFNEENVNSLDSIDINLEEEISFLQNKKQNIASLNNAKKQYCLIDNDNKADKKNINITNNEKKEEKKGNVNIDIIIDNNDNTEKNDIHFIGKKRNIFKVIFENCFNIFNDGEYDNYSKRMIKEAMNENKKKSDNLFVVKNFNYPKIIQKELKTITKRKYYSDLIRKKIKARFYKYLKGSINEKLKLAGSIKFFGFIPQSFISNISKEYNISFLNLTFEDFLSQNLCIGKENKKSTLDKYHHNLSVLEYLKNNKEISRKSNFNNIKNMKLYEIYDEYLNSKEFKMDISKLKQQKETDKYIKKYIIRAINLIDYFYY
jgi:hypothetical protein